MTIASEMPQRSRFLRIRDSFFSAPFAVTQLPVIAGADIDPQRLKAAAHVKELSDLTIRGVRQVCLPVILDWNAMLTELRTSIEDRCILWVVECPDTTTEKQLREMFPQMVNCVGTTSAGSSICGIHTASVMRHVLANHPQELPRFNGIDTAFLPHDIERKLKKARVPMRHTALLERKLREPRTWLYITVFVYSALRALPAMWVPQFHGSVFWLWTIDIVTAIPYTWGLLTMFTASKYWLRFLGFATAVTTFVLPYVYFWMHGDNYPKTVSVVIAVMILLSLVSEMWRFVTEKRLAAAYRQVALPAR